LRAPPSSACRLPIGSPGNPGPASDLLGLFLLDPDCQPLTYASSLPLKPTSICLLRSFQTSLFLPLIGCTSIRRTLSSISDPQATYNPWALGLPNPSRILGSCRSRHSSNELPNPCSEFLFPHVFLPGTFYRTLSSPREPSRVQPFPNSDITSTRNSGQLKQGCVASEPCRESSSHTSLVLFSVGALGPLRMVTM
jgi:hypothetical protein